MEIMRRLIWKRERSKESTRICSGAEFCVKVGWSRKLEVGVTKEWVALDNENERFRYFQQ